MILAAPIGLFGRSPLAAHSGVMTSTCVNESHMRREEEKSDGPDDLFMAKIGRDNVARAATSSFPFSGAEAADRGVVRAGLRGNTAGRG